MRAGRSGGPGGGMTGLLLAALERLPARARRVVVAMGALLGVVAAIAALTLTGPRERDRRHRRSASPPQPIAAATPSQRLPPPVAATDLFRARMVAERFLADYLPFAYGRASAATVVGVTPALRRQLLREPARVPAEQRRRPRVVSLQLVGPSPLLARRSIARGSERRDRLGRAGGTAGPDARRFGERLSAVERWLGERRSAPHQSKSKRPARCKSSPATVRWRLAQSSRRGWYAAGELS